MLLGTDVEAVILAMGALVLELAIIGPLPGPDRESSCTASIRLRPSPDKSGASCPWPIAQGDRHSRHLRKRAQRTESEPASASARPWLRPDPGCSPQAPRW